MKPSTFSPFTLALLASLLALTVSAGTITYTYDAAGRLVLVDYGGNTNLYKIYDNAGNVVERSAPGPILHHVTGGTQTQFAWTVLATNFTLVSTPSLRSPIAWTPVAITPGQSGGQFTAILPNPSDKLFYILRR